MKNYLLATLALLLTFSLTAQPKTRIEDHFYRRTVVQRIDLNEKMNRPLQTMRTLTGQTESYSGLVRTLLKALEEDQAKAYSADDFTTVLPYDSVRSRMCELSGLIGIQEGWDGDWDDGFTDEFEDPEPFDEIPYEVDTLEDKCQPEYADYESVVQIVEDWIFDKNRGEMIKQIKYIQIIWTDPGETLPEKYLAVFKYEEVKDILDEVQWANRHNDAEHRSIKEALELRLFHSFVINVSGRGVQSLPEAEQRRQELIAFEHHLWNY